MANVTDYGLAFTEFAGALLALTFLRGMFLYARARLQPPPVVAPVRVPAGLFRGKARAPTPEPPAAVAIQVAPDAEPELPLAAVITETRSAHVEEAADGSRLIYWSLIRHRRDHSGSED